MLNHNGNLTETAAISPANRAFLYGDGIFETFKILDGRVLFLEDHYFRLMASMRIVRMEIPMHFTMEFVETEILKLTGVLGLSGLARVRMTVYREGSGRYLPTSRDVSFLIAASGLEHELYQVGDEGYEVDIYKDFYVTAQLLSTLKTTNRILNIAASIYAAENGLQNCLLLNDRKNVVEALNGNIFLLSGHTLITPPLAEGCLNGIMREQVLGQAHKMEGLAVEERPVSPFELQKADEMFITNVISGLQPVTRYRKKKYATAGARALTSRINTQIRLG